MASNELIDALASTAEICNARWSDPTKLAVVRILEVYPEKAVLVALQKCCMELRNLTVADILARIDDGRPGVEEAWAMLPKSESASCVWTDEMAEAHGVSRLIEDPVAGRMAFKEKYVPLVAAARAERKPARWTPTLGFDRNEQERVLKEAVQRGRLTAPQAAALLPDGIAVPGKGLLMIGTDIPIESTDVAEKARELSRLILKDAPAQRQALEELHQKHGSPQQQKAHEERVRDQLEQMKGQNE